jgi:lysophospholipase L1-like esterase
MNSPAERPGRLVALGDSFSCGEGVGVRVRLAETWVGLLGATLGLDVELLAEAGTTTAEVRQRQLPQALAGPAELVTLLVGLNDVIRAGSDTTASAQHIQALVEALCDRHPVVLVARLHDPLAILPMPPLARRRYAHRIAAVNAAIDAAVTANERAVRLDLGSVRALRERRAWSVDRIHPSPRGHRAIAAEALLALGGRRLARRDVAVLDFATADEQTVSVWDELRWLVCHAAPWLAKRALPVVWPVLSTAVGRGDQGAIRMIEPGQRRALTGGEQVGHG